MCDLYNTTRPRTTDIIEKHSSAGLRVTMKEEEKKKLYTNTVITQPTAPPVGGVSRTLLSVVYIIISAGMSNFKNDSCVSLRYFMTSRLTKEKEENKYNNNKLSLRDTRTKPTAVFLTFFFFFLFVPQTKHIIIILICRRFIILHLYYTPRETCFFLSFFLFDLYVLCPLLKIPCHP